MRRGFFLLDVLMGLALLGIIALVLAVALSRERRAAGTLAASRSATRSAEAALIELQAGRQPARPGAGEKLAIRPTTGPAAPAGYRWIKVDVTVENQHAVLVGLAPAIEPGGTP